MNLDRPHRIPDGIEPLVGYRMWSPVLGRRRASLHSMNCSENEPCPWEGDPSNWVTASCTLGEKHRVPEEGCSCGIYARKSPDLAQILSALGPYKSFVLGRVELAGKVVEHDEGYRAERARIAELMPSEGQARELMLVANRLGIPMSPPLRPPLVYEEYAPIPIPRVVAQVEVRGARWLLTRWWLWWGVSLLVRGVSAGSGS